MKHAVLCLGIYVAVLVTGSSDVRAANWEPGDDCARVGDASNTLAKNKDPGARLDSATYFVPAGASVDLVLHEPYQKEVLYFGAVRTGENGPFEILGRARVNAGPVLDNSRLLASGLARKTDTLITASIPDRLGTLWRKSTLYIYKCAAPGNPYDVSPVGLRVSKPFYSAAIVWTVLILVYALMAFSARIGDERSYKWYRYFDPVVMTAGSDGKGSLAKLQVLFFTIIVFGLVSYIVLRTGILSDLSPTVLLLLGIAGVGSAAAKASDAQRNKLDFENWAWLARKRWVSGYGLAAANKAKWHDIFTTDGEFDVYRFQSFVFCLAVGVALVAAGLSELASFRIPETLLGILGLSQIVYIGGKLVTPTSVGDLNTATTELRGLERKFIDAAWMSPSPGGGPVGPPADLQAAVARAGFKAYKDYKEKAEAVALLVKSVTGNEIAAAKIEPDFR